MRFTHLSSLLLAAALLAAPSAAAIAGPVGSQTSEQVAPAPRVSEAAQYAVREAKDAAVQKFQGGGEVVIISSSAVAIVLLVVLLVVLL